MTEDPPKPVPPPRPAPPKPAPRPAPTRPPNNRPPTRPTLITAVDSYRVEARVDGQLAAYAITDTWGWALMCHRDGRVVTAQRVDYGTTARRNARVGTRLAELVAKLPAELVRRPRCQTTKPRRRTSSSLSELKRMAAALDLPVSYFTP